MTHLTQTKVAFRLNGSQERMVRVPAGQLGNMLVVCLIGHYRSTCIAVRIVCGDQRLLQSFVSHRGQFGAHVFLRDVVSLMTSILHAFSHVQAQNTGQYLRIYGEA